MSEAFAELRKSQDITPQPVSEFSVRTFSSWLSIMLNKITINRGSLIQNAEKIFPENGDLRQNHWDKMVKLIETLSWSYEVAGHDILNRRLNRDLV